MGSIKIWNYVVFLWIYSGLLRSIFPGLNILLYLLPFLLAFFYLITTTARNNSADKTKNLLILYTIFTFGIQVLQYLQQNISLRNVFTGLVLYSLAPSIIFLSMNIKFELLLLNFVRAIKIGIPINLVLVFLQVTGDSSFFTRSKITGLESLTTDGKVLRAIGTFSHSVGFSTFLSVATVMAIYFCRRESKASQAFWIFQISLLYLLSGSRTVFINLFLILLMQAFIYLKFSNRANRTKFRNILGLSFLVLFTFMLVRFKFTSVLDAFTSRVNSAAEQESSLARILNQNFGWFDHIQDSFWGDGLGFYSTGTIGFEPNRTTWVEDDLLRIILEAGSILGLFIITLRWILPIWVFVQIRKYPNEDRSILLLLLAAIFTNLIQGSLTGQGSVAIQVWLITGICISSIYENKDKYS